MARLLEPGEIFERWLVLDRYLGSWGVVYVVRTLGEELPARPGTLIAKALRPEFAANPDRQERFEAECSTWLSLGIYKHIARLFFLDRLAGQVLAFGEYVPAQGLPNTLRGWLDHNLVELEFALRFGLHIISALEFARSRGLIVHQDLKPENVLITPDGVAKVTDWGLSRMAPGETAARRALSDAPYRYRGDQEAPAWGQGTRGYAAPELAQPGYAAAPQADVFSLAVMLGEMMTGQRPAAGTRAADLAPALRPLGGQHQAQVTDLLASCLSPRPELRPASAGELRGTLAGAFEALAGIPAEPPAGESPQRLSDLGQRAYGLMMLGRIDEGLQLQAELMRAVGREPADSGKRPMLLMDYKERGWKLVVAEEDMAGLEADMLADQAEPARFRHAITLNQETGRLDRALELCQQWLAAAPDDPAALEQCADVLADMGRRADACACLDRAIAAEPTAGRWMARAEILDADGDRAGALRSYERAAGLEPDNAAAHNGQGHELATMGERRKHLVPMPGEGELGVSQYYRDQAVWAHGLYSFKGDFSLDGDSARVVTYLLWRRWQDSIILLAGSPENVLGERVVRDGVWAYGTTGTWATLLHFAEAALRTDEPNLVGVAPPADRPGTGSLTWLGPDVIKPDVEEGPMPPEMLGSPRALALGTLCLGPLAGLPAGQLDTAFRVFQRLQLTLRAGVPSWVTGQLGQCGGQESLAFLRRCKTVYVGSPLYTALQ